MTDVTNSLDDVVDGDSAFFSQGGLKMRRIIVLLSVFLLVGAFAFAGGQVDKGAKAAPAKPVWVWGTPAWAGDYDEASLAKANEWSQKMFGTTFTIKGHTPSGSTPVQALNLIMAQGEFPDVMIGFYGDEGKKLLVDLAKQGKTAALDKYFSDPKNYPVFAEADKDYLRAYLYQGKIFALPGYGWIMKKSDPWWNYGAYTWIQRLDVYEKFGAPKTLTELYAQMQKIKADKTITDLEGKPTIPFGWQPDIMGGIQGFATTAQGAGWEVDAQKRLMPQWAAQEYYNNLKYLNMLWREGMMSQGAFTLDVNKFQEDLSAARYAFDIGSTWNVSLMRDSVVRNKVDKLGKDNPETKAAIARQHIMLLNPVQDNPGRITNDQVGMTFMSAKNPNLDGTMKMYNFILSDEGLITQFFGAGYKDVHWKFMPDPQHWQLLPAAEVKNPAHNQDAQDWAGGWRDAEKSKTNPPLVLPVVQYGSSPSYSSYTEKYIYARLAMEQEAYGFKAGLKPGEPTINEWGLNFATQVAKIAKPIPSYQQVIAEIPALENSAMTTATQRLREGLAKVVSAASEAEFETEYKTLMTFLVGVTNWKPIYEARQKRWVDWMAENKFDDRPSLATVTPVAAWKTVMGW